MRLPEDTPARLALLYARLPTPKPRGRQKLTWCKMMENIFSKHGMTWDDAYNIAQDRKGWNEFIKRSAFT